jgi:hypothetical protein
MLVDFLARAGPLTFEALAEEYGTGVSVVRLPGRPNVVLWHKGTEQLCSALDSLFCRDMLRMFPTSPGDYVEQPHSPLYRKGLATDCWLPVLIALRSARAAPPTLVGHRLAPERLRLRLCPPAPPLPD